MKLNKIILSIFGVSMLLASCENAEFLDRDPYTQTSPESFYKSPTEMRMGLIGCYEVISGYKIPGASYVQKGTYAQGMLYIMNGPSDCVVGNSTTSTEGTELYWANYHEATEAIRDLWKTMYAGISRCNFMLHYLPASELDEAAKLQYEAELKFLRAFYYYHLAWNFGGVPLVLTYDSDGMEARSNLQAVYAQILSDLGFAYEKLNSEGVLGSSSANKYTAAAYIGRICNYLAACKRSGTGAKFVAEQPLNDFAWVDAEEMSKRAYEVLKDVVDNSSYVLVDDYTNLFREGLTYVYKESLLTAELAASGVEGYWPNSYYLPTPANNGVDTPNAYGGRHVPTPKAFYMYHKADPRRDHNFTGRLSDAKEPIVVDGKTYYKVVPSRGNKYQAYVLDSEGQPTVDDEGNFIYENLDHPLYDSPTQSYLPVSSLQTCPGKYSLTTFESMQHTHQQHACNIPLMRLADVHLMYAEAIYFHQNNETLAREQLNIVLERACRIAENPAKAFATLKQEYRRENFLDELLESRERELIFEFSRKWDLIRFNLMDTVMKEIEPNYLKMKEGQIPSRFINGKKTEMTYLEYPTGGTIYIGLTALKNNWESYKIWLPISEEQIGVNRNLKQNAGWAAKAEAPSTDDTTTDTPATNS